MEARRRAGRAARLLPLVVALVLALGGSGSRVDAVVGTATKGGTADWTMMIYAVGDTSSVPEAMVRNLNLLTQIPDAKNVHIVALVDLPERNDPSAPRSEIRGIGQFTTAKLMVLENGRWNEIRDLGEKSLGRPDVLAGFIEEAADRFPARKYGLTLFDHGAGASGGYIDTGPPNADGLSISEIRAGMASGLQQAGIPRFDVLYHAACLMSSYETVSALAPVARIMAGSEELMISTPILPAGYALMARNASAEQVAATLSDAYGRFLEQLDAQIGENTRALAAMSVVDGDKVRALDQAVDAFARAAQANAAQVAPAVARARAKALEFIIALDPDVGSQDLVDLGDFLRNLGPLPTDVSVARDAVYGAIRSSVTHQVTGKGTQQATGLNVYLPTRAGRVGTYLRDGTAPVGWGTFLTSFLGSVTAATDNKPDAQFNGRAPRLEVLRDGARLTGQLRPGTGSRAVSARTQVQATMAGYPNALALIMPGYLGAGGADQVQGVWSYDTLVISDGRNRVPVSSAFKAQSGGLVGSAYALYTSPAGARAEVAFRVLLASNGRIQAISASAVAQDGSAAGVRLETGGTLRPFIGVETPTGFDTKLANQALTVNPRLAFGFSRLPSRTPFAIGLVVGDVADQRDATFAGGRVP